MKEKESIPFAPALVESMRSLGYSFKTAVADLIDNSISAGAKNIDIMLSPGSIPVLCILDDGSGMSPLTLEEAMRYGSTNPLNERKQNDLGRFGLGMKSASLSQCRKLTVASKKNNTLSAFSWNLDKIIETGKWSLMEFGEEDSAGIQNISLLERQSSGTLVVLENFDRIKKTTGNLEKTFTALLDETMDHLALVFHRYIEEGVRLSVNTQLIEPRDPFLLRNSHTIRKRSQSFDIDGKQILVKPYILPHTNKLNQDDIMMLGGKESLRSEQGFYVYRSKRLIIWGTWFNLENKYELNKLARVRVDIPNSLDYVWSIDVKKSSASLPDKIKKNLHSAVFESVQTSERVHSYRGRKENQDDSIQYAWERLKTREGFSYRINRKNPKIELFRQSLTESGRVQLERVIRHLEESIPAKTMYLDVAGDRFEEIERGTTEQYYQEIMEDLQMASEMGLNVDLLLEQYLATDPYCEDEILKDRLRKELVAK